MIWKIFEIGFKKWMANGIVFESINNGVVLIFFMNSKILYDFLKIYKLETTELE